MFKTILLLKLNPAPVEHFGNNMEISQGKKITKVTKIFHIVRWVSKDSPYERSKESFHIHELHARMLYPNDMEDEQVKLGEEHLININNLFRNVLEAETYNGLEDLREHVEHYLGSIPFSTIVLEFDQDCQYKLHIFNESRYYNIEISAVRRPWGNTLQEIAGFHVARMAQSKENITLLEVPSTIKEKLNQFYEVLPPYEAKEADDNIHFPKEQKEDFCQLVEWLIKGLNEAIFKYGKDEIKQTSRYEKLLEALTNNYPYKIDICRRALTKAYQVACWTHETVHKI